MKECIVKGVSIGSGKPKICVPIVEKNKEDILTSLKESNEADIDIIELRIDHFKGIINTIEVKELLEEIKKLELIKPILFTYRSKNEGGEIQLSEQQYQSLIQTVCRTKAIDIVDIEYQNPLAIKMIEMIHSHDLPVLLSNHDFHKTPSQKEIVKRLQIMESMGGDIVKIAVMPNSTDDVLTLLSATNQCYKEIQVPVVAIAMQGLGLITRIVGEVFGSAITFATLGKASAPGQIAVEEMYQMLDCIHNNK